MPAGGNRKRRSSRIARVPYRAQVSAARACPTCTPSFSASSSSCASFLPREDPCHTRARCPAICTTVHYSLTRFPAVTLATFFLIFLPPFPLLLLSFSAATGRSRLTTPRGACCGSNPRPECVSKRYVMPCQVADCIGDESYDLRFLYDILLQRSSV